MTLPFQLSINGQIPIFTHIYGLIIRWNLYNNNGVTHGVKAIIVI